MEIYITPEMVHNRAIEAKGRTIGEIDKTGRLKKNKGAIGQAIEEGWFDMQVNSDARPDFETAGVELKVTPVKRVQTNKRNKYPYSSKERLVLNMIDYVSEANATFETSSFWKKNKRIEIMFYEWLAEVDQQDYKIIDSIQYSYPEEDLKIIKQDWEIINKYIREGRAHELSESLTQYLSACTKGANKNSVREQYGTNIKAKKRAYSFKSSYMTELFREYVLGEKKSESIIKDRIELESKTLFDILIDKYKPYIGMTQNELKSIFNIDSKAKNINNILVKSILGINIDPDNALELKKANIKVKTIEAIKGQKQNKEEFKIFPYKFSEIIEEDWESSQFREFLQETNFFLVVFEKQNKNDNNSMLKGVKFFSFDEEMIDNKAKHVWTDTVNKIKDGVEITHIPSKTDKKPKNVTNFINSSIDNIFFSKLSSANTSYEKDSPDSERLPAPIKWINRPDDHEKYSDYYMTKQAFWINKKFMYEQIKEIL